MGLCITVGPLSDFLEFDPEGADYVRDEMIIVNGVLQMHGLPRHDEPETLPKFESRAPLQSFSYSYLHHLRAAYAFAVRDLPLPNNLDVARRTCPELENEFKRNRSHLICHSDAEGFYVPIDFEQPLVDPQSPDRVPGRWIGSTQRLQVELLQVAPSLGLPTEPNLSDEAIERLSRETRDDEPRWIPRKVWVALIEACRLSLQFRAAIQFA